MIWIDPWLDLGLLRMFVGLIGYCFFLTILTAICIAFTRWMDP